MVVEPDDIIVVPETQLFPNLLRDLSSPSTINLCDNSLLPIHARRTYLSHGANYEVTYQFKPLRFHVDFTAQKRCRRVLRNASDIILTRASGGSSPRLRIGPATEGESGEEEANSNSSNKKSWNMSSTVLFSIASKLKS